MKYINLATEDLLSEAVGIKLISEVDENVIICNKFRKSGNGYLKSKLKNFCDISNRTPVLMITDLDNATCAPSLIAQWLNGRKMPNQFLFRIAVREVESWLLADDEGMRHLLARGASNLPTNPDSLPDPKRSLLALASRAPRDVRDDLSIARGAIASQGIGYNARLGAFVRETWSPPRASERSASLFRARKRLRELLG